MYVRAAAVRLPGFAFRIEATVAAPTFYYDDFNMLLFISIALNFEFFQLAHLAASSFN